MSNKKNSTKKNSERRVNGDNGIKDAHRLAKLLHDAEFKFRWPNSQTDRDEMEPLLKGLSCEGNRIIEETAAVLGVSPKLKKTYGDCFCYLVFELAPIAEIEPTITELINKLVEASISGRDKPLFERIFREIAVMAIKIAKDREVADQQKRLFDLAENDVQLALTSSWYDERDDSAVELAVAAFLDEKEYCCHGIDDEVYNLHSNRCSGVLSRINALSDEHGPEMVSRCVEIVTRHLRAQTESSKKGDRSRESVHDSLRANA